MRGMKLQFSLATLLLIIAVAAITFGSFLIYQNAAGVPDGNGKLYILYQYAVTVPLWLPIMFIFFAVARKSLTVRMLIFFAIAEAAAIGAAIWSCHHWWWFQ
jgi:hypothetical protein